MPHIPATVQALVSDPGAPCWARSAVGVAVAVICWLGYLGARAAYRHHGDGRVGAARLTGVAVVVGVLGGFTVVWIGFTHLFPA